jgi:HEAT repeats
MLKGHDNEELAHRMDDMLAQIGNAKMSFMYEKEILQLGDHCVLPLTRFIQSEGSKSDQKKRANAARILAKIARPWSVEDLIGLVGDDDREVRYYAAKALERLTDGQTQGLTPEQWRDANIGQRRQPLERWRTWWQQNREQFPTAPFSVEPIVKDKPEQSPRPTKS